MHQPQTNPHFRTVRDVATETICGLGDEILCLDFRDRRAFETVIAKAAEMQAAAQAAMDEMDFHATQFIGSGVTA